MAQNKNIAENSKGVLSPFYQPPGFWAHRWESMADRMQEIPARTDELAHKLRYATHRSLFGIVSLFIFTALHTAAVLVLGHEANTTILADLCVFFSFGYMAYWLIEQRGCASEYAGIRFTLKTMLPEELAQVERQRAAKSKK